MEALVEAKAGKETTTHQNTFHTVIHTLSRFRARAGECKRQKPMGLSTKLHMFDDGAFAFACFLISLVRFVCRILPLLDRAQATASQAFSLPLSLSLLGLLSLLGMISSSSAIDQYRMEITHGYLLPIPLCLHLYFQEVNKKSLFAFLTQPRLG